MIPASRHPHDLSDENLERALATAEYPDLLRDLVETSRRAFGLYTRHFPHTINYPWTIARLNQYPIGSKMLDFAAGISPLPLYLAERGMHVDCVDNGHKIRTLPATNDWNEWGYFDYSVLHPHLAAFHCGIEDFKPSHLYDAIYCVSAIAHFPSPIRQKTLQNCWAWLKPTGRFVLPVDLIPGTDTLWNGGSGETPEQHGTYKDIEKQILSLGFSILESRVQREVYSSRTDLYFLLAQK